VQENAGEEGQRVGTLVVVGTAGMPIGEALTAEKPCDASRRENL